MPQISTQLISHCIEGLITKSLQVVALQGRKVERQSLCKQGQWGEREVLRKSMWKAALPASHSSPGPNLTGLSRQGWETWLLCPRKGFGVTAQC